MSNYGLKIGNLPPITGGRKFMVLLSIGVSEQVGIRRFRYRFHCHHRDFCIYFRPNHLHQPIASQYIHDVGGGVYDAYFVGLGTCTVYVYERKQNRHDGLYGLRLFNQMGEIAFDQRDEPMNPLPNLFIPPILPNGGVKLYDQNLMWHRAFNMHMNRVCFFRPHHTNGIYWAVRDTIVMKDDGVYYHLDYFSYYGGIVPRNPTIESIHNAPVNINGHGGKVGDRWSGLSYLKPTSVGVCDTSFH